MLKIIRGFFNGLATLRKPWRLWIALLGAVNMMAIFFLDTLEGKLVMAAFLAGATFQMSIFAAKGCRSIRIDWPRGCREEKPSSAC
jgi:hypothetical protein